MVVWTKSTLSNIADSPCFEKKVPYDERETEGSQKKEYDLGDFKRMAALNGSCTSTIMRSHVVLRKRACNETVPSLGKTPFPSPSIVPTLCYLVPPIDVY